MFYATFNNVSVIYHACGIGRGFRRLMVYATFNIDSVIYHTCVIGRGFRRLMFIATFNNVSVIYRTCALGRGVEEAHVFCHFQYCFSHLPLLCCRQGGSADSCFMPLLIMFQYFTAHVL
jgi:hypothetical protein